MRVPVDQSPIIAAFLDASLQHCAAVVTTSGGLIGSLFIAGLIGSLSHCTGMCGPFVLAQVAARLESIPATRMHEFQRLRGALLLPYHLGRMTTYAAMGGLAGLVTNRLADLAPLRWLSATLLLTAAAAFVIQGIQRAGIAWIRLPRLAVGPWAAAVSRVARPFAGSPLGWRGYGLGVVLGFIPCGLLYAALAIAAATASPVAGAFGMVALWAGTVPSLFAVGWIGQLGLRSWRAATVVLAPIVMILNGAILAGLALRWVA